MKQDLTKLSDEDLIIKHRVDAMNHMRGVDLNFKQPYSQAYENSVIKFGIARLKDVEKELTARLARLRELEKAYINLETD